MVKTVYVRENALKICYVKKPELLQCFTYCIRHTMCTYVLSKVLNI
jgi:hypothetical protein